MKPLLISVATLVLFTLGYIFGYKYFHPDIPSQFPLPTTESQIQTPPPDYFPVQSHDVKG